VQGVLRRVRVQLNATEATGSGRASATNVEARVTLWLSQVHATRKRLPGDQRKSTAQRKSKALCWKCDSIAQPFGTFGRPSPPHSDGWAIYNPLAHPERVMTLSVLWSGGLPDPTRRAEKLSCVSKLKRLRFARTSTSLRNLTAKSSSARRVSQMPVPRTFAVSRASRA
jgi:hypothetical protein